MRRHCMDAGTKIFPARHISMMICLISMIIAGNSFAYAQKNSIYDAKKTAKDDLTALEEFAELAKKYAGDDMDHHDPMHDIMKKEQENDEKDSKIRNLQKQVDAQKKANAELKREADRNRQENERLRREGNTHAKRNMDDAIRRALE